VSLPYEERGEAVRGGSGSLPKLSLEAIEDLEGGVLGRLQNEGEASASMRTHYLSEKITHRKSRTANLGKSPSGGKSIPGHKGNFTPSVTYEER